MIIATGLPGHLARWTGQLLWQRGWRSLPEIASFLDPACYTPAPTSAFGPEMDRAIARLSVAHTHGEKVAIWGDFDADGLTATAVLWEGLGQFFPREERLCYYIPNRFTESHGLSHSGLDELAAWGATLIVTCDTGSTAAAELAYAQTLGLEVIVTDHHTLPQVRPPVVALVNPRQLPADHPLADLSGVAVAYKLVEALYARLPAVPCQPLKTLLDLVAIGLVADLVKLQGDCRYLSQVGLKVLEQQAKEGIRPGVAELLTLCKRTGDRPSDVAFGIGPRINAISRIHGEARFGVELLTSRDRQQATRLALQAELANTRRKALQASVFKEAVDQLATLDLSTTQVIVLSDPQWSPGVLGLVASQLAQQHGRPTILFQTETVALPGGQPMAWGSARSVNQIDLYELVQAQAPLLTSFGGHPYAAGLALRVSDLPLFIEGINRALRSLQPAETMSAPPLDIDLTVTVADLGRDLFKALRLLEPYGMGNPVPRLLLKDVHIGSVREHSLRDQRQRKQRYHKVEFVLSDRTTTTPFPGHWWGHRRSDLPEGRYDVVVELDVNFSKHRYEARLIDFRASVPHPDGRLPAAAGDRQEAAAVGEMAPTIKIGPTDWSETVAAGSRPVALASPPPAAAPEALWRRWLGIAKYLARTGEARSLPAIAEKLGLGDRFLPVGIHCWRQLGYGVRVTGDTLSLSPPPGNAAPDTYGRVAQTFMTAAQETLFQRGYFYQASSRN